ncbi:MAG: alpha-hydroxy-acid oxidizing protein [Planctomycetota bacterium]|jgi:isopentenyl diphosphate isomerase/L-lactate dehydrogenase-like FMN-dependent dehydrogenase|nr:alpha-hydroxy-acid oxidizing protein [Planctomycetota bacterium]
MADNILAEGNTKLAELGLAFAEPGGPAGSSVSLTRRYLDSLLVEFRVIDAVKASTGFDLFGETFSTPVMTAALSGLDRVRLNGMAEMAGGAARAGAVMWAGIGGEDELKAMIDTGAKVVKIVKPYRDIDLVFKKLEQAERFGAFAVGMDADFVFGRKDWSAPVPMGPKTLDEIKSFVKAVKLPFVVKGVLSEADAVKAVEAGAAGVVVSHHGGALMDWSVPPAMILPRVVKAAAGRLRVFADCGVVGGMDAFKLMALGADAVSVGKAIMAGLAAAGADGVCQAIRQITDELKRIMSQTACASPAEIPSGLLWTTAGEKIA